MSAVPPVQQHSVGQEIAGNCCVPETFLPKAMLRDVSIQHERVCQQNRRLSTVALITVLRYTMCELSKQSKSPKQLLGPDTR